MKKNKKQELLITTPDGVIPYSEALRIQEEMRAEVQRGRESRNDKYALNPPTIYTAQDVVSRGDKHHLRVKIAGKTQLLPLLNIGTEEDPTYIAVVDPSKKTIEQQGSKILAHMLSKLGVQLVITPPSSKSEKMIRKASKRAKISEKPLTIAGGSENGVRAKRIYTKKEVGRMVNDGTIHWVVECRPITLAPDDPSKYFGINETMLERIIKQIEQGNPIAIVDDVYSSGATIQAIQTLISNALESRGIRLPTLPIVVVAQERPEHLLDQNPDQEIYSDIIIPVLTQI